MSIRVIEEMSTKPSTFILRLSNAKHEYLGAFTFEDSPTDAELNSLLTRNHILGGEYIITLYNKLDDANPNGEIVWKRRIAFTDDTK